MPRRKEPKALTEKQWGNSGNTGNLTPFKPGQTGNPGGRPKGRSLTSILRQALDEVSIGGEIIPLGLTAGEYLVQTIINNATKGDATLAREIFQRVDGKVPDIIEIRDMSKLSDAELLNIAKGASRGDFGASETREGTRSEA